MNAPSSSQQTANPAESGPYAASAADVRQTLAGRSVVMIGMMGAGKSSIGRRLAQALGLDFVDSDDEIEKAANLTIPEIFERHGEAHFRDGERKVIARLVSEKQRIIALGGGAFENPKTREEVARKAISIWIKADFETLMERVKRRSHRPLLQTPDPEGTLRRLIAEREPNYARAAITVTSNHAAHTDMVRACMKALAAYLSKSSVSQ
ncbi:MAG: shikimate kinase [Pseudomonadota bacterium]